MSEKTRQKKDGKDPGKKRRRMKVDVKARKRRAAGRKKKSTDEVDTVKFKPGSARDKTRVTS